MPQVSASEWQNFINSNFPHAHILQTSGWGELKGCFGWQPVRIISGKLGVQILFRKLPAGFSLAYLPKPVFGLDLPPLDDSIWHEIDEVCRKRRAVFLKVEPDYWEDGDTPEKPLISDQFIPSTHNIQPPRTIVVPLDGSEEDVLARMKQKCRYNVRLAEKKGVVVRPWDDLDGFYELMQATGSRDGFGVHSLAYYRKAYELFHPNGAAELLLAEFEGKPLAALMIFFNGRGSWYLYGASNDQARNRMPTYLLQWAAIKLARSKGCSEYDLWGVPDADEAQLEEQFETRQDGLWGVYRFKRGFGGQVRRAAQAQDKIYIPWLYRLYTWRMAK